MRALAIRGNMELSISWSTIVKLMAAGAGTYIILPALLIIRDLLLWKTIEYFILNSKLQMLINIRANDVWHLNNRYNYQRKMTLGNEGKYYLDEKEVSQEEFYEVAEAIEFHGNRADKAGATILWRSNLINWILQHYKQDKISNPIPEWEKRANERKSKEMANRVAEGL